MDTATHKFQCSVSILFFCALFLAACGGGPTPLPTVSAPPSGLSATVTPVPPPPVQPTSTQACTDNLTFLYDLTIPDFTAVTPGSDLDKQWLVQNSGTCNWDDRYRVRLISGDALGANVEQALYPARSGSQATLRILFKAPLDPGTYLSEWQAYDPSGAPFGATFFIKIVVSQ